MSKYGEFDVVRTERRKCKRANDPNADAEGMREYSYLKCPHCSNEDIEIASGNLEKQKHSAIRDHMLICPSFTGERPVKRTKTTAVTVVGATAATSSTAMVPSGTNETVEERLARMEADLESTRIELSETKAVVMKHDGYWNDFALMLGFQPPKDPPFLLDKCREQRAESTKTNTLMLEMKDRQIDQQQVMIRQQEKIVEQKDAALLSERRIVEDYKQLLEAKHEELSTTMQQKSEAEQAKSEAEKAKNEAEERVQAAGRTVTTLTNRADKLQKERDALEKKFKAVLKGHEQSVMMHGKHERSLLALGSKVRKRPQDDDPGGLLAFKRFEKEWIAKRLREGKNV